MKTPTTLELLEFNVLPASSSYEGIGEYSLPGYQINFSPKLTRTCKNHYDSMEELPEGSRYSTAGEELAIQLKEETEGRDPRKASVFDDLFARNKDKWYAWQWTETGLRVPKGWENGRYETDETGDKKYPRIVLIGDEEVGEVLVPEGNGRVIPYSSVPEEVWSTVFGIPKVTSDKESDMKLDNHTTHFYFDPNPSKDSVSGEYDVAVARGSLWHRDGRGGCLYVFANCGRWDARSDGSFRQVQGSLPEINTVFERIDPEAVEAVKARTTSIDDDAANLTARQFKEKYGA